MTATAVIWLVRHGETDWNTQSRIQGSTDIALNEVGKEQARRIADYFAEHALEAIYSSPLQRAMQTASPLASQLGLAIQGVEGLMERNFGDFQGKTLDELATENPSAFAKWQARDTAFVPVGGESIQQFYRRVTSSLEAVIRMSLGKTVAIFTHGGVLDMVYRHANGLDLAQPRSWPIDNASIQHLAASLKGIEIRDWGFTGHLAAGRSRDELRGIA